ncbi:hypothetical protein IQ06DRAFT_31397 [Phaeosphaeriaceae sp. SRC1lsM3a]|nr:hypothetical protein IQ06DRAFT_31397 [Stagonospora sp. SRC1lsM3a]
MHEAVATLFVWLWPNPSRQCSTMAFQNRFVSSQPQVGVPMSFMFADILASLRSPNASGCAMRTVWNSSRDYAECASLVGPLAQLYKIGLIRLVEWQNIDVAWTVCKRRNALLSRELDRTFILGFLCIFHSPHRRLDLLLHKDSFHGSSGYTPASPGRFQRFAPWSGASARAKGSAGCKKSAVRSGHDAAVLAVRETAVKNAV